MLEKAIKQLTTMLRCSSIKSDEFVICKYYVNQYLLVLIFLYHTIRRNIDSYQVQDA